MSFKADASKLVGKNLRDEDDREIGTIRSFLIDSSGRVQEALVEDSHGKFVRYPVEKLKVDQDEVSLASSMDRTVKLLSEEFLPISKKRKILDRLSENKVIPQEIYQSLCKEFDKALKEMKSEAQSLLEDMDKQVKIQEDYIKTIQLARAFLEIEHGMGTIDDEVHQQSVMSLLKEVKSATQRKLNLLRTKDEVSSILLGAKEETKEEPQVQPRTEEERAQSKAQGAPETESTERDQAIPVRVTQE